VQDADAIGSTWGKMNFIVGRGTYGSVAGIEPFEGGERKPPVGFLQFGGVLYAPRFGVFLPLDFLGEEIRKENAQANERRGSEQRSELPRNHGQSIYAAGAHRECRLMGSMREERFGRRVVRDATTLETKEGGVELGEVGREAIIASVPFFATFTGGDAYNGEVLRIFGGIGKRWKMLAEKRCRFGTHQAAAVFHRQHSA
jgi:hypothetical protein